MGNDIFTKILSVIPTVGQVVGQLLGGNANDYVGFFPSGKTNDDLDTAVFTKDGDSIFLNNTSPYAADDVVMAFPRQEGIDPETISIPNMTKLDVTNLFHNQSAAHNESFSLTTSKAASNDNGKFISIQASGRGIPVSANASIKIGSFLEIQVSGDWALIAIIAGSALALRSVNVLRVRQLGQEVVAIVNAWRGNPAQARGGQSQATIDLGCHLLANEPVDVEISAEVEPTSAAQGNLDLFNKKYPLIPLTQEDIARLKKGLRLNSEKARG